MSSRGVSLSADEPGRSPDDVATIALGPAAAAVDDTGAEAVDALPAG
jgi:hypothetical protein